MTVPLTLPSKTLAAFRGDELRARVFWEKYSLRGPDGQPSEQTPKEMWDRVARGLAAMESTPELRAHWQQEFRWLLNDFRFLPGGRILHAVGQSGVGRKAVPVNCLAGETLVLVQQHNDIVVRSIRQLATGDNQTHLVLTIDGTWRPATFAGYGVQQLLDVELTTDQHIYATAEHEWVAFNSSGKLLKRRVPTSKLAGHFLPVQLPAKPSLDDFRVHEGIRHGIVFGDGTRTAGASTAHADLFGPKQPLATFFRTARGARNGTSVHVTGVPGTYKDLPSHEAPREHWYGFILGFLATDGYVDTRGMVGLTQKNPAVLDAVVTHSGRTGFIAQGVRVLRKYSPFDGSLSPCHVLRLRSGTFRPEDFLRADHRARFTSRQPASRRRYERPVIPKASRTVGVRAIRPTSRVEEVFCCVEPVTHTFTLASGIVTGQCFVLPLKGDTLADIYECAKEMAITYSRGGGVGVDISALRPRNAVVHNAAHKSTGAVSFMETFSLVTGTIGQSGRRGALMITIRDDHPDVLDFVKIKRNTNKIRFANISVLVSDAFMHAVEADGDWRLHFDNSEADVHVERTIKARELWGELIQGARDWAEPGCLFIDNARRHGTTEYNGMNVLTTNPCAEEWLDPYNNCDLGSINLTVFVKHPFPRQLAPVDNIDWDELRRAVRTGVRFLDNVITYSDPLFPLEAQREAARRTRRIGFGITGLGDLLVAVGLRYDSTEAIAFGKELMTFIKLEAYRASADLARDKDVFPAFDAEQHLGQEFFRDFPQELLDQIRTTGLRNAALMTVAPTGSISAMAAVTSGVEPIFALAYQRRSESLSQERFSVIHPLAEAYLRRHQTVGWNAIHNADHSEVMLKSMLPDYFVTAHEIDPFQRVRMQAAIASQIDNSVSSTVNLSHDVSTETVGEIYRLAWKLGCKGITVYRAGSREGILLTGDEVQRTDPMAAVADHITEIARTTVPAIAERNGRTSEQQIETVVQALANRLKEPHVQLSLATPDEPAVLPRPEALPGVTRRVKTRMGTMFVTINEMDGQPVEVFCRLGKGGSHAEADSEMAGRLISFALRVQTPSRLQRLEMIAEQLDGIGGGDSLGFGPNRVKSIADAIAKALYRHLTDKQGLPPEETAEPGDSGTDTDTSPDATSEPAPAIAGGSNGDLCPQCHQYSLITNQGCTKCTSCSYKEC